MPEAILAMRSYPITLLLAGLLFLCSLVLATASIGKIIGGAEDEGSGMGGTGKSGDFGGSGFGGTGGPSPFFSVTDEVRDDERAPQSTDGDVRFNDLALPFLLQPTDTLLETAEIQRPMDPRTELPATRPPAVPDDSYIGLDAMTPAQRHLQELADAARDDVADTVITLEFDVVDPTPRQSIAEQIEPFEMPQTASERGEETVNPAELAGQSDDAEPLLTDPDHSNGDHRASPERIQRPELPPFQRMRPAQGASVAAPRPMPMRI